MKKYSAFVKDKFNGNKGLILRDKEYATKADFISDIRSNGYSVNPKMVKESALFDYIMNHTNCDPWDWDLRAIPNN